MLRVNSDPKTHQLRQLYRKFRHGNVLTFRAEQRIFLSQVTVCGGLP
jgi:hypothetical protein